MKKVKIIKSGKKRVKTKPLGYGIKRNRLRRKEYIFVRKEQEVDHGVQS